MEANWLAIDPRLQPGLAILGLGVVEDAVLAVAAAALEGGEDVDLRRAVDSDAVAELEAARRFLELALERDSLGIRALAELAQDLQIPLGQPRADPGVAHGEQLTPRRA